MRHYSRAGHACSQTANENLPAVPSAEGLPQVRGAEVVLSCGHQAREQAAMVDAVSLRTQAASARSAVRQLPSSTEGCCKLQADLK